MSVALKQKVISGDSIRLNSPESSSGSRILIANPDQSPAAILIRELRKELDAANRKCLQREEEVCSLKGAVCEKENAIKNLRYEHSFKLEKQAFTIGRQLEEKDVEIRRLEKAVFALEKQLEDYRETDIEALKNQLDSAMRGLLCRDEQLKKERAEFKKRDKAKDTKIALIQRKAECACAAKDDEIAEQKREVEVRDETGTVLLYSKVPVEQKCEMEVRDETISLLKSEERRVLSEKAVEIAALEFELRRVRSKSCRDRIGCYVCGVFTLPVLVFLIAIICN